MVKEEFEKALHAKLLKIPLETRKTWMDDDLYLWWAKEKAADSYLTWEGARGDVWQFVPGMCRAYIGPNAVF